MKDYNLQPNEVLLYKGDAYRTGTNKGHVELLFTNLFLVLIIRSKKLFSKEEVYVETYPVQEIKMYSDVPQIKQESCHVELYFSHGEEAFDFSEKSEARKFVNIAFKLLTGKTIATRGAEKFNGAVGVVDKALGINTVDTVKNVLENGVVGSVLGGFHRKATVKNNGTLLAKDALGVAKDIFWGKQPSQQDNSITETASMTAANKPSAFDEKVESLKKLKDLLDSGILTQEEFDVKKKEILGL